MNMNEFLKHARLLLSLMVLAGCTAMPAAHDEYWIKADMPRPSGEAASLLYYFDYARKLPAAELGRETDRLRQSRAADPSAFRTLQYALALSIPGGDAHRAGQVLEPLLREPSRLSAELHALAQWLAADLAERRRLEAGARRADELEKRLEALKNIEKNLMQRESAPGDRK